MKNKVKQLERDFCSNQFPFLLFKGDSSLFVLSSLIDYIRFCEQFDLYGYCIANWFNEIQIQVCLAIEGEVKVLLIRFFFHEDDVSVDSNMPTQILASNTLDSAFQPEWPYSPP